MRKTLLFAAGLLFAACSASDEPPPAAEPLAPIAVSTPQAEVQASGQDAPAAATQYVAYVGVIGSLNPKTGEIVMMGSREDLPDKEMIVKLQADPNEVDVTDVTNRPIDLEQVVKGDSVMIDCRIDGNVLTVESIFVYVQKPE